MKDIHENSTKSYQEQKASGRSENFRFKIFNLLLRHKEGLTDRQLMDALCETDVNNIRPEITRLTQDGLVVPVGKTRCQKTGKTVRVSACSGVPYFVRRSSCKKPS